MTLNFGLKSFFRMTTLFAWIVFVMQFALLVAEYSSSSLSTLPKWLNGDGNSGKEMIVVLMAFAAFYIIDKFFKSINFIIVRISAKLSKKDANERAKFIFTEDYHTPYPLNFIWIVLATIVTVVFFFMIDPYAGWGADPELTSFFVPGSLMAYLITILGLYRMFSTSWDDIVMKTMFIRNFSNEEPVNIDLLKPPAMESTNNSNSD